MLDFVRKSLSGKILLVLSSSVAAVMAGVIYLTYTHQTREMLREMTANNEELASTIHAGIKYPMSIGDSRAVQQELLDIGKRMRDVEVFICDTDRNIVFFSREDGVSSGMDRYLQGTMTRQALARTLAAGGDPEQSIEETASGKRYFVHIHAIPNQKECVRCHGAAREILGAIILRKEMDRQYAAFAGIRNNSIIVSTLGIGALILLSYTLLARLVRDPIRDLAADMRKLPEEISREIHLREITTARADEIGDLQNSFTRMALELNEKTHAIEQTSVELAKANKELESFAYSVSHDLRAPLRNIDGFSKILLEEYSGLLDERAKHYLGRVRNGSLRMSMLIDDILTFSRIGRTELQVRHTSPKNIVNGILVYYAGEISARGVAITMGELPEVRGDPTLLQSLFANLLSNALKYTRKTASPKIEIGYDAGRNALFVRDNGIGFDMQYHDKIFQVFQRLHLPEEFEGTGIGLAIVKRIAERHRGAVWAESKPGEGTTFFVRLPVLKEGGHDQPADTDSPR